MHYVGRATGMDCDCDDMHHCEIIALGVGKCRDVIFTTCNCFINLLRGTITPTPPYGPIFLHIMIFLRKLW